MTEFYRIQIEQAAAGCISSPLSDWPDLIQALKLERIELPMDTPISTVTRICRLLEPKSDCCECGVLDVVCAECGEPR